MTIGSVAFQLGLQAGWFNRLTWLAPWAWGLSAALWLWWVVTHPKIEDDWLKALHVRLGSRVHLIRIFLCVVVLICVALGIRATIEHMEPTAATVAQSAPATSPVIPAATPVMQTFPPHSASMPHAKPSKKTKTKTPSTATSSGNNSPAIGSISQGAGSALSVNQQGGITAGTVNLGPPPITIKSTVGPLTQVTDPAASNHLVFARLVTVQPSSNWSPIAVVVQADVD